MKVEITFHPVIWELHENAVKKGKYVNLEVLCNEALRKHAMKSPTYEQYQAWVKHVVNPWIDDLLTDSIPIMQPLASSRDVVALTDQFLRYCPEIDRMIHSDEETHPEEVVKVLRAWRDTVGDMYGWPTAFPYS
jgi:hypothetical protein